MTIKRLDVRKGGVLMSDFGGDVSSSEVSADSGTSDVSEVETGTEVNES